MKNKILKNLFLLTVFGLLSNTCSGKTEGGSPIKITEEDNRETSSNTKGFNWNSVGIPGNQPSTCDPFGSSPCSPLSTPLPAKFLDGTAWSGGPFQSPRDIANHVPPKNANEFTCYFKTPTQPTSPDTDEGEFSINLTKGTEPTKVGGTTPVELPIRGTYSYRHSISGDIITFNVKSGANAGTQKQYHADGANGKTYFDYPVAGVTYRLFKQ